MTYRIGLIGLDTSHAVAFTSLLNDPSHEHHIAGATVTRAFPGGSPDFEPSRSRVEGFTQTLRDEHGITIVDRLEEATQDVDMVFILSVDGRTHRAELERVLSANKPVFVDKPFATSLADAQAMVEMAQTTDVPIMSSSALRFVPSFAQLLDGSDIQGIDVFGPMAMQPGLPGYFWYGIHSFEMIVAAMGTGCESVAAQHTERHDTVTLQWPDGRQATIHGVRETHKVFGATLHTTAGPRQINTAALDQPLYVGLLRAILSSLPHGRSAVPTEHTLEVIRLIETANQQLPAT